MAEGKPNVKVTGEVDFSRIPKEMFQAELVARVAVVREGEILASATVKPSLEKPQPFQVEFAAPVPPGARLPCPVTLVVGPNVADADLLGLDAVRREIDLAPAPERPTAKRAAAAEAAVKVGRLIVEPAVYRCWIICCRTYTIRGRVVCRHWHYNPVLRHWGWCDDPVPGARVEVYDVDCFWWWCRQDRITTATTAVDGSFEMTFSWCCTRLYPWLRPFWSVDPDLLRRIRQLLEVVNIPVPPIPPGPDPDPILFQEILSRAAALPGPALGAASQIGAVAAAPAGPAEPVSAEALRALLPEAPDLAAQRVWPWWTRRDCAPDVIFRVTQVCDGEVQVIYSESRAQTRWDIPTTLNVTLPANDKACCTPICRDPECPECLTLTWAGCTPSDQIGVSAGPPDLRGYAYTGASLDRPFYGSVRLRGAVGWDVDYFKVQYSKDGGPWTDMPVPVFAGFSRRYWDGAGFVPVPFNPAPKAGQTVIITRRHYEDLNPGIPRFGGAVIWDDFDTLLYFNTANAALTPDGLYQLRFVGFAADAADNLIPASERVLPACGRQTAETIYLRIDNQGTAHPVPTPQHPCTAIHKCTDEPDCYIRSVCKNEGRPDQVCISACDIVRLKATDTLTIHFSVSCPPTVQDGHLGGYWLRAEYGVSQVFYIGTAPVNPAAKGTFLPDPTLEVGPDYTNAVASQSALAQAAPRPHWYGGDYKVTLTGADFPACCAYLLRLWAWKRTTNGCTQPSLVHWNQFELSFTILRPELCPEVCPDERSQ